MQTAIGKKWKVAVLLLVIIAHTILVMSLLAATNKLKKPTEIPKNTPVEVNLEMGSTEFEKGAQLSKDPCSKSYIGLGIRHWGGDIIEIAPDSPIERAGVRATDVILNPWVLGRNRYPLGTKIVLEIERDSKQISIVATIGVICEKDQ